MDIITAAQTQAIRWFLVCNTRVAPGTPVVSDRGCHRILSDAAMEMREIDGCLEWDFPDRSQLIMHGNLVFVRMKGPAVRTEYICPVDAAHRFNWRARTEGREPMGAGETEADAVADLHAKLRAETDG